MVISASLQACGVVFPLAMLTSICRSIVTICSGLYLLIGMTRFSSKWILSHSTWYKSRRSGQFAELEEANATICCPNHDLPKRTRNSRKRDGQTLATLTILVWRHSKMNVCALVHAARRAVACLIHGLSHFARSPQFFFELFHSLCVQVLLRRKPGLGFEGPLEIKGTHSGKRGQIAQPQRFVGMLVHVPAYVADSLRRRIGAALSQRPASSTWTKAILLGFGRTLVEPDVLAERLTRSTGRLAIDAGREDAEKKPSVLTGIALLYCSPALVVVQHDIPPKSTSASTFGEIGSPQQVKYCRRVALLTPCQKILGDLQTMSRSPISTKFEFRFNMVDDDPDSDDSCECATKVGATHLDLVNLHLRLELVRLAVIVGVRIVI